jgi:hypothetical protein
MTRDIAASIAQFSDYFQCELEKIETLQVRIRGEPDHTFSAKLYQKILYVAVLDTLSRAAFPCVSGNRERVLTFIDTYTGWHDRNKISSSQLKLALEDAGNTGGALYRSMKQCVDGWSEGTIILPDSDPEITSVIPLAATRSERIVIKNHCYASLFYTFRNHLVHEFRNPAYQMEQDNDPARAYYHSIEGDPWQLLFPAPLFRDLCRNGLQKLVGHLKWSGLSPHASFRFECTERAIT